MADILWRVKCTYMSRPEPIGGLRKEGWGGFGTMQCTNR